MKKFFLFLFCVASHFLFGDGDLCPGQFEVYGEFIYFKPQIDQPQYVYKVVESPTGLISERIPNCVSFSPGFRVGGIYSLCNSPDQLHLRYTHFNANGSDDTSGVLVPTKLTKTLIEDQGFSNFSKNRLDFQYRSGELFYTHNFVFSTQTDFSIMWGLHFAYFKVENETFSTYVASSSDTLLEDSTSYGIGPQIGLHGKYSFTSLPCLMINSSISGGLLANRHDVHRTTTIVSDNRKFSIDDEKIWRVIPYTDIRAGLSYDFCVCSFGFNLELGYEFLVYWKGLYDVRQQPGNVPRNFSIYSDLSFQGPYLNLAARF